MKNYLNIISLILFSIFFFNSNLTGQSNTFNWNDTIFEIGSTRQIYLYTDFDGPCSGTPCYDFEENHLVYDTIINFLKLNPNVKIEIGFHADPRGSVRYNQKLTERRARGTKDVFWEKGVLNRQIDCLGYGETFPLDTTKPEINRRIEVKIVKNEIPFYIQTIQKDTSIQDFYSKQGDFFWLKGDTINNTDLKKMAIFLEKLFKEDTSYVLEMDFHIDARGTNRYSHQPNPRKDIKTYIRNNYKVDKSNILEYSCSSIFSKRGFVVLTFISKSEHKQCLESSPPFKMIDGCTTCPF